MLSFEKLSVFVTFTEAKIMLLYRREIPKYYDNMTEKESHVCSRKTLRNHSL